MAIATVCNVMMKMHTKMVREGKKRIDCIWDLIGYEFQGRGKTSIIIRFQVGVW